MLNCHMPDTYAASMAKSSKIRLLTFELRGRVRQCFTRGWSRSENLVSDDSFSICEHPGRYRISEYEPMCTGGRACGDSEKKKTSVSINAWCLRSGTKKFNKTS